MTSKKGSESEVVEDGINVNEDKNAKEEAAKIVGENIGKQREDLLLYVGSGFEFKSAKGDNIKVPPLAGINEKQAILAFLNFLSGNSKIMDQLFISGGNVTVSNFITILLSGGEEAWDCIVKITASLLGKHETWVADHLMLPDMIKVVRPFFLIEGKALMQQFKG